MPLRAGHAVLGQARGQGDRGFSERAIEQARDLAAATGLDARFVVSDVVELPASLEGDFDVVFTSLGVLSWLPDVPRWAEVVAHFVRPGGFHIAEAHPFAWAFDDEDTATELRLRYHYWPSQEPLVFPDTESYADPEVPVEAPVEYAWQHSMGEIVTSLASAGCASSTSTSIRSRGRCSRSWSRPSRDLAAPRAGRQPPPAAVLAQGDSAQPGSGRPRRVR